MAKVGEILRTNFEKAHLDLKDQKIISILTSNAKTNISNIAKEVELSKSNISRRINKYIDQKIILGFHANIDAKQLGIYSTMLFIKFNSLLDKDEYIQKMILEDQIYSMTEILGTFDLILGFYHTNTFNSKQKILDKVLDFNKIKEFKIKNIFTNFTSLNYLNKDIKETLLIENNSTQYKIDETDYKILSILSENCRIPIIELANNINIPRETVQYRLKKLESQKIIGKYQPNINYFVLGIEYYILTIRLKRPSQKNIIIKELSNTNRFNTILEEDSDTEIIGFGFFYSIDDFRNFETKLITKFHKDIFDYSFEIGRCQHKLDWMPDKNLFDF